MRLIDVETKLEALGQPVFETRDVAAFLNITTTHASHLLSRLKEGGRIVSLARGLWGIANIINPWSLPNYLTAPFPSYISLQTALFYHGMISQIPEIIYAVSLARARRFTTPLGTISIHHIQPDFFFGFNVMEHNTIKMATPEKALLDVLYLSQNKTRLFASFPELELPANFQVETAYHYIDRITSTHRKARVHQQFERLLKTTGTPTY